jgi:DNA replication initiation complex subunit (GINS family)
MRKLLFLSVIIGIVVSSCSSPKSDADSICKCREKVMKKAIEVKGNRNYSDLTKEENDKISALVKECDDKEQKFTEKYKDAKATEFKDALDACFEKVQKEYDGKLE